MTNKKDDDDRKDLTRIEDLSEFLHQDDPEIDNKFGSFNTSSSSDVESSSLINLDELDSDLPPEIPTEEASEANFEAATEIEPTFDFSEHSEIMSEVTEEIEPSIETTSDFTEDLENSESTFITELDEEAKIESIAETEAELEPEPESEPEAEFEDLQEPEMENAPFSFANIEESNGDTNASLPSDNFEEVKSFAQNFSYGTIEGAGNPPFSVIIRNIKFKEEADDILALLTEFGIINEHNQKEIEVAINLGSLLVSQISEYTAIILAHKLRRYDLDIEIGLSDEIHPSKSGESNPKGLTKKSSIKQNVEESYKRPEKNFKIADMIITNAPSVQNYKIVKILGIDHAHCTLSEDEISRSAYIHQRILARDLSPNEMEDFKTYKKEQDELHNILLAEIKNRAFKEGANALLSVQFNLNSLSDHKQHFMKLTCTCTKVILEHE